MLLVPMRKRAFIALGVLALLLASLLFGVHGVWAQHTADGQGFPLASSITITFPSEGVSCVNSVLLNITFNYLLGPNTANASYSIDRKDAVPLPLSATLDPKMATRTYPNGTEETVVSMFSPYIFTGSVTLPALPNGTHIVTVYTEYNFNNKIGYDSNFVSFEIVNSSITQTAPEPTVSTPLALPSSTPNQTVSSTLSPSAHASPLPSPTSTAPYSPIETSTALVSGLIYGALAVATIGVGVGSVFVLRRKR